MLASQRAVRKMPRVTSADFLRTQGEPLRALLRAEYEITGAWHALPGEADANFKVSTEDDDYLVKVSASGAQSSLQLQAAAVEHLATTAPTLRSPRSWSSRSWRLRRSRSPASGASTPARRSRSAPSRG